MSKNNKSHGTSGTDDISGLFERFGAGADAKSYQPFNHPDLPQRARPTEPVVRDVPPPATGPAPTAVAAIAPLHKLRPVEVDHAGPAAGADTPLAKLFQRLLQDGAEVRDVGPLRRLFPR